MPLITEYELEEHTWRTGFQYTEQDNYGYRIKLTYNKMSFYSEPIKDLKEGLAILEILKEADGR